MIAPPALFSRLMLIIAALVMSAAPVRAALTSDEILKLPHAEIEKRLPSEHPAIYYLYAGRLMKDGDTLGALRWFYIGQLRYRVFLQSHPGEDSSAFGGLNESLGTLNRYGALHIDQWLASIDAALAWDESHDNSYTDKAKFADIYTAQRAGMAKLKDNIVSNAARLKARASGREEMPEAWPALISVTSAKDLEGIYGDWDVGSETFVFFPVRPAGVNLMMASELELRALTSTRLLIIARGKNGELARGELDVRCENGAVFFSLPDTTGQSPHGGGSKGTVFLHRNTAKDLVVERDQFIEEYHNTSGPSSVEPHRVWKRAPLKVSSPTEALPVVPR